MSWLDPNNRLSLTTKGFTQQKSLFHSVSMNWRDIREAVGIKRDVIAYPDNFIILISDKKHITISEADAGFRAFEPHLFANLPGFPEDWYEQIEDLPFEFRITLWKAR